jgi:superfamily II DNA/RNA helicase
LAKTATDYLHRAGRVGRLGQNATLINLVRQHPTKVPYEVELLNKIETKASQGEGLDSMIKKKAI